MPSVAETALYESLKLQVTKAATRLCPAWLRSERDDIVQVAMLRLHQIIEAGEGQRLAAASYIWKTAFSVTVDEIRRRSRRPEVQLDAESEEAVTTYTTLDPERQVMARETGIAIRDCVRALVETRRAAVVLHLQGHTVAEIATLLGWPAKKADNSVYRGVQDLRACLKSKGVRA